MQHHSKQRSKPSRAQRARWASKSFRAFAVPFAVLRGRAESENRERRTKVGGGRPPLTLRRNNGQTRQELPCRGRESRASTVSVGRSDATSEEDCLRQVQ